MLRFSLMLLALLSTPLCSAYAGHGVDMFDSYGPQNQVTAKNFAPSSKADMFKTAPGYPSSGGDMFKTPPGLMSSGGDVFGAYHPNNGYSADVFNPRRKPVPADPLYYWP